MLLGLTSQENSEDAKGDNHKALCKQEQTIKK